jgi:hypothetical protein
METTSRNVSPLLPKFFIKFLEIIKKKFNIVNILYSVLGYS